MNSEPTAPDVSSAPRTVPAMSALRWYSQGWRLFLAGPATWVVVTLLVLSGVLLLDMLPVVGPFVTLLLTPLAMAGVMGLAQGYSRGLAMQPAQLLWAFRDPFARTRLLRLGVLLVLAHLAIGTLGFVFFGDRFSDGLQLQEGDGPRLALLLGLAMVVSILNAYAVPLVAFAGCTPTTALVGSFKATLINPLPMLVFGLISAGLGLLAVLPFGLGLLVFAPVSWCALYLSFHEIFSQSDFQSPGTLLG